MLDKFYFQCHLFFQNVSDWFGERISEDAWEEMEAQLDYEFGAVMAALGKTKITVYHVIEGPIHRDNIPDDEEVPEGLDWLLEVKATTNNSEEVEDLSLWFKDFNEAYSVINHFHSSVEPKVFYL